MKFADMMRGSFGRSQMVMSMLLSDLTTEDIMQRPAPGANHVAWQLGHLITSTRYFGETIRAGSMPELPQGFEQQHSKETAGSDDPAAFLTKDQYVSLLDQQRAAMLALACQLDEAALAADAPEEVRSFAPRVADMMGLVAEHEMMHSGQISVLRRKLGKPVAF